MAIIPHNGRLIISLMFSPNGLLKPMSAATSGCLTGLFLAKLSEKSKMPEENMYSGTLEIYLNKVRIWSKQLKPEQKIGPHHEVIQKVQIASGPGKKTASMQH